MKKTTNMIGTGGSIERDLVQRKLTRMAQAADDATTKNWAPIVGYLEAINELRAWLKAQPKRTVRPGGIGR